MLLWLRVGNESKKKRRKKRTEKTNDDFYCDFGWFAIQMQLKYWTEANIKMWRKKNANEHKQKFRYWIGHARESERKREREREKRWTDFFVSCKWKKKTSNCDEMWASKLRDALNNCVCAVKQWHAIAPRPMFDFSHDRYGHLLSKKKNNNNTINTQTAI